MVTLKIHRCSHLLFGSDLFLRRVGRRKFFTQSIYQPKDTNLFYKMQTDMTYSQGRIQKLWVGGGVWSGDPTGSRGRSLSKSEHITDLIF